MLNRNRLRKAVLICAVLGIGLGTVVTVYGAGTAPKRSKPARQTQRQPSPAARAAEHYRKGVAAAKQEDFKTALRHFTQANRIKPNDPETLNMLAFSLRKTGKIDEAIEHYHKALKLRPCFPQAREYLGEAYIQAALREITTLKRYGKTAEHEYEDLVEALFEAADKFRPEDTPDTPEKAPQTQPKW